VVTAGPAAEDRIVDAVLAAEVGQPRQLPLFLTTLGLLVAAEGGPFDPIWRVPGDSRAPALASLAGALYEPAEKPPSKLPMTLSVAGKAIVGLSREESIQQGRPYHHVQDRVVSGGAGRSSATIQPGRGDFQKVTGAHDSQGDSPTVSLGTRALMFGDDSCWW
jgi:hypothetical protein